MYEAVPAGDRREEYNEAYQLISQTGPSRSVAHEYDEWGNEWRRTTQEGASTKIETYTYNHLQRLSAYTNSQSGAVWTYDFWPTGDRYSKTNIATSQSELYLHRGNDVAADYTRTSGGTPIHSASYVQGLGIDSKTLRVSSSGERRYYLSNLVGTVGAALDNAGAIVQTTVRDAWGRMFAGSQTDRYGFAQREHDTESGLIFMRHRMYDTSTGRFTQTDPIRSNRPNKHYSYGSNMPISRCDPRGLQDVAKPLPEGNLKWLDNAEFDELYKSGLLTSLAIQYERERWHWRADIVVGARSKEYWIERSKLINAECEKQWSESRGRQFSFDFLEGNPTFEQLQGRTLEQRVDLVLRYPELFRGDATFPLLAEHEGVAASGVVQNAMVAGIAVWAGKAALEYVTGKPLRPAQWLNDARRAEKLKRLIALGKDPAHRGAYKIGEVAAALRFEARYGGRLIRAAEEIHDFRGVTGRFAGKTFNVKGDRLTSEWYRDGRGHKNSIMEHFGKDDASDYILLDLRHLGRSQIDDMRNWVGALPDAQRQRILPLDW